MAGGMLNIRREDRASLVSRRELGIGKTP